jgi:hypothetical protein
MAAGAQNGLHFLRQADYILNSCGRQIPPPNTSWVDLPSVVPYTRFLSDSSTQDIGGISHSMGVSFWVTSMTAQSLPRATQGAYWRLRFASGRYFQSALTSHAMAFGFGSDRQAFLPAVEWKPGEKMFVDLSSFTPAGSPSLGYSIPIQIEGYYRFPITGPGAVTNPLNQDLPRYYQDDPNQNILAPPWMFGPGCPSETPAGYQDEDFRYATPTTVLNIDGTPQSNIAMQVEPGSDFMVREIWPYIPANTGSGSPVVRMRRGDGYVLSSNFLPATTIQGPLFKELKLRAGDNFYFDAAIVNGGGAPGSTITFGLYLMGVKRRRAI